MIRAALFSIVCSIALGTVVPAAVLAGPNSDGVLVVSAGPWTGSTNCASLQRSGYWFDWSDQHYPSPGGDDNIVPLYVARSYGDPVSAMGADVGIEYGEALEVISWTHCGYLEVPTPGWPASGAGTTVVWSPSLLQPNVLVGWFRVNVTMGLPPAAYEFRGAPHPMYDEARVVSPQGDFDTLWLDSFSVADFYNPAVPVRPETWGRIKAQYGR